MDNIISKMKYELGDLKYQLMVSKEKNNQLQNEHKKEVEELQNNLIEFDKELNIKRVSDEVPEGFVRKDVYELMFDKATRQDNTIENLLNENSKLKKKFDNAVSELFENSKLKTNANSKMVFKLEKELSINLDKLSELREFIKLQDNKILELYEEKQKLTNRLKEHYFSNEKLQGHRYAFSNIPNDEEGNKFVEQMKLYFNYDSYDFRKRGQYLDNNKLSIGESWKTYEDGQPLSKSRCIRIYIDKKKEGK
jgi:hypothetical protein